MVGSRLFRAGWLALFIACAGCTVPSPPDANQPISGQSDEMRSGAVATTSTRPPPTAVSHDLETPLVATAVPLTTTAVSPTAPRRSKISPTTTISPISTSSPTTASVAEALPEEDSEPRSFTIAATGDLLIHGPISDRARFEGGWDFTPMFQWVAPILRAADLAVCHVESPLSPDNTGLASYPRFLVPNQLADAIRSSGYDTCSLASNHAVDWGLTGVAGTIEALDRLGVAHSGMARSPEERERLNLLQVRGATVAHLSYSRISNVALPAGQPHLTNLISEQAIREEARRARRAGADFIILSLHWGWEFRSLPNPYQADLGPRLLSSPDIDLILGHHAHVVQPVAEIDGEYLAYGLGNFLSRQSPGTCRTCPAASQDGVILHLTVVEDATSGLWRVTEATHTPTRVEPGTFEIVNVLSPARPHDPVVMAASAQRTARTLESQGTKVPPRAPLPNPDPERLPPDPYPARFPP